LFFGDGGAAISLAGAGAAADPVNEGGAEIAFWSDPGLKAAEVMDDPLLPIFPSSVRAISWLITCGEADGVPFTLVSAAITAAAADSLVAWSSIPATAFMAGDSAGLASETWAGSGVSKSDF
jgi:hypothetical protein